MSDVERATRAYTVRVYGAMSASAEREGEAVDRLRKLRAYRKPRTGWSEADPLPGASWPAPYVQYRYARMASIRAHGRIANGGKPCAWELVLREDRLRRAKAREEAKVRAAIEAADLTAEQVDALAQLLAARVK